MESSKLKLKLLVDKPRLKVLFAEAGKDVVDFLFSILALPVGEVVRLLGRHSMVGSLGKLYHSVESLDDIYIQVNQSKSHLLRPRVASPAFAGKAAALTWNDSGTTPEAYYSCNNRCRRFSDDARAICPNCCCNMTKLMEYVPPPTDKKVAKPGTSADAGGEGGFVKGVVTYMVMDDLAVAPMSTISSITLLNKYGVKEVGLLERTVDLDMSKALEMLRASLQSTTVLTDVFLPKK